MPLSLKRSTELLHVFVLFISVQFKSGDTEKCNIMSNVRHVCVNSINEPGPTFQNTNVPLSLFTLTWRLLIHPLSVPLKPHGCSLYFHGNFK